MTYHCMYCMWWLSYVRELEIIVKRHTGEKVRHFCVGVGEGRLLGRTVTLPVCV